MKPAVGSLAQAIGKGVKSRRLGQALGGTGVNKVSPLIQALELYIQQKMAAARARHPMDERPPEGGSVLEGGWTPLGRQMMDSLHQKGPMAAARTYGRGIADEVKRSF